VLVTTLSVPRALPRRGRRSIRYCRCGEEEKTRSIFAPSHFGLKGRRRDYSR
jgi:hypothetical protein